MVPNKNINAVQILEESLKDLQIAYVDLYLVHTPISIIAAEKNKEIKDFTLKPHHIMWYEMEDCYQKGLTKSIGVSNFNVQSLANIISFCRVKPSINQIEVHPFL